MRTIFDPIYLLLLWMVLSIEAHARYYRRNFYSEVMPPPTSFFQHQRHEFVPRIYTDDLFSAESKLKPNSKKYSRKIPFRPPVHSLEDDISNERYSSGEYSNEAHGYNSHENTDSREFTIGTQIRVQHPITIPKKHLSSNPKHEKYISSNPSGSGSSYSDFNLSTETFDYPPQSKKKSQKYTQIFEQDPFHVIAPPKKSPAISSSSSYHVYDADSDDYEQNSSPSNNAKYKNVDYDRFKGVASKKQIEKYLENQQKILDETLKLQLLSNPKIKQLLKSTAERDHFDLEQYEHELPPNPPPIVRPHYNENLSFKPKRTRRRPKTVELLKRPPNLKPIRNHRSAIVINV